MRRVVAREAVAGGLDTLQFIAPLRWQRRHPRRKLDRRAVIGIGRAQITRACAACRS
jgi:hypothetical protein